MDFNSMEELLANAEEMYQRLIKQANATEAFIKTMRKSTNWKNPALYKTTICTHWQVNRKCKYGPKCWYAHGIEELRTPPSGIGSKKPAEQLNGAGNTLMIDSKVPFLVGSEASRNVTPESSLQSASPKHFSLYNGINADLNFENIGAAGFTNGQCEDKGYFSPEKVAYQHNVGNLFYQPFHLEAKDTKPIKFSNPQQADWPSVSTYGRKMVGGYFSPLSVNSSAQGENVFQKSFHPFGDSNPLQGYAYAGMNMLKEMTFNPTPGAVNVKQS